MTPFPMAAPLRTADAIRRLEEIDAALRRVAVDVQAEETRYPTLIAAEILTRAEYPDAFPHLLMSATARRARTTDGADGDRPDWCLSPAVCYHTYAQFAGSTTTRGLAVTARGRCVRAELQTEAGVRQLEFEMREIVLLGRADWVDARVEFLKAAVGQLAGGAGLAGVWEPAEDPFFLPAAAGKAMMQRLLQSKLEYRLSRPEGVALISVNRHGTFFGDRFAIATSGGQAVTTACVAIGLDRWWHASESAAVSASTIASRQETP